MEFADPSLVANAMSLDNSLLRGRAIKVLYIFIINASSCSNLNYNLHFYSRLRQNEQIFQDILGEEEEALVLVGADIMDMVLLIFQRHSEEELVRGKFMNNYNYLNI